MPTDIHRKSPPRRGNIALDAALVAATRCLMGVAIALALMLVVELVARQAGVALELQAAVMTLS